jgi:hypothetical protein
MPRVPPAAKPSQQARPGHSWRLAVGSYQLSVVRWQLAVTGCQLRVGGSGDGCTFQKFEPMQLFNGIANFSYCLATRVCYFWKVLGVGGCGLKVASCQLPVTGCEFANHAERSRSLSQSKIVSDFRFEVLRSRNFFLISFSKYFAVKKFFLISLSRISDASARKHIDALFSLSA